MAKPMHPTPFWTSWRSPWPSFVTGIKRLAKDNDMAVDLLGQLETSYETAWLLKAHLASSATVRHHPRSRTEECRRQLQVSRRRRISYLRIMPAAGMHYDTGTLRKLCDIWVKHGSGLIALHGQSATSCSRAPRRKTCRRPSTN